MLQCLEKLLLSRRETLDMSGADIEHESPPGLVIIIIIIIIVIIVVVVVELVVEAGLWVGARRGWRRFDETGEIVNVAVAGIKCAAYGARGG